MKYDVLVVDDEEALLQGIVRGLSAVPTLNPVGATSLAEAVAVLDREPPDLLLTDIRLAGDSGLDLISEVLRRGLRIPVVVMTAYRAAFADELSRHRGLTVLEKPVPLADLRRIVEERLELARTARHEDPFDLSDYLQLASLGRSSLRFDIELDSGEQGRVEAVDGEIWNAWVEDAEGRQAVGRLLGAPSRKVGVCRLEGRPQQRQMETSTESLLLELAAAADEAEEQRAGEESPATETIARDPVRPPQAREDAAAARWCRKVVEEVAGALCCRLLEIGTAAGAARWPPEVCVGEEKHRTRAVLALFCISGADTPAARRGSAVEEASVAWPAGHELMRRVSAGRVLALSAGAGVRPGLAWLALRRAAQHFAASLPPESTAGAGTMDGAPLPCELDPALDRAAARVATGIAGARWCAVVQLPGAIVRGASEPGAPELTDAVLARSADLFGTSGGEAGPGGPEAADEVLVSSASRHYLLARVPGGNWIVVLVADTAVRLPVARLGLRDALPLLAAALQISAAGG